MPQNQKKKDMLMLAIKKNRDGELFLLDKLHVLEDQLTEHIEGMKSAMSEMRNEMKEVMQEMKQEMPNLDKVLESVKGKDSEVPGPKPVAGVDYPIPQDGKDYVLTPEDKKEIASKVKVPIVEKVIEKTEVIKEQPIITNEIKEVAVTEKPEEIRDKLESLKDEDRLDKDAIKGLKELLEEIKKTASTRIVSGFKKIMPVKFSFTGNGSTTSFALVTTPADELLVFAHSQGQWLQPTVHFNIRGKNLVTTYTPANGDIIEGTFLKL